MDWQAQQGLQRAKWGLKYNIMVSKNHCMCVSFTSWCEQLILGVKHIVPTFEHSAARYLQATCQLLLRENQINHIASGMSHLKISFRLWFYIAWRVGGGGLQGNKWHARRLPRFMPPLRLQSTLRFVCLKSLPLFKCYFHILHDINSTIAH